MSETAWNLGGEQLVGQVQGRSAVLGEVGNYFQGRGEVGFVLTETALSVKPSRYEVGFNLLAQSDEFFSVSVSDRTGHRTGALML